MADLTVKPSTRNHNHHSIHPPIHPPRSAGRLMITNIPTVPPQTTVSATRHLLSDPEHKYAAINYIYVVNSKHHLVGVVSIKEILQAPPERQLKGFMQKKVASVRVNTDQEHVAALAIKHNIKAVPVINHTNQFLGVVTADTILDILHQEHTEDFLRSAGIQSFKDSAKTLITASGMTYFIKRFPWLTVGLIGGILAASVVSFFEEVLSEMLILASFIPAIVYIGDAVGTQTQTVLIRSLAIDRQMSLHRYIVREAIVSLALAATLGGLVSLIVAIFWPQLLLVLILGISIFLAIVLATIVAMVLPLVFYRLKLDPAVASGPLATVIRDILSITIYLFVAQTILRLFPG